MNKELIIRLSKYRRLLHKFKALGLERVFSNNLGDAIDVTPALVRKDFSVLELPGNKRGGYNIDEILGRLDDKLGLGRPKNVIIVGCGKIGTALLEYRGFAGDGLTIVAGFDIDPENVKAGSGIPIYHIDQMHDFVVEKGIEVGVIAVPDDAAADVLDRMVSAGIKGILNFAPVELKCPKRCSEEDCPARCIIHNINIGTEIENLFYLLYMKEKNDFPDNGECERYAEKERIRARRDGGQSPGGSAPDDEE